MTYKWVKEQTLKLLNQYSVAGREIPVTYNNQEDYLKRIPSLVNDAMMEIATTVRKIPETMCLTELLGEEHGNEMWYELPDDFYQFKSGDTVRTTNGRVLHTNLYSILGKKTLVIPKKEVGDYYITYYRYPRLLDETQPWDDAILDNDPETHAAIPFYVASFLVAQDNSFLCALFTNKFDDKLSKMLPTISASAVQTEDVYRFDL